ncbi:flagellar basal-body rod protein FlgF [Candidatus Gastranaerophilus sp. (ex Termes propinquus)]|nr:flagellar basal-body rod protein FlgF [Candidatus Gastranaerophilus sp. (ex Termes propinquus)]
MKLQGGIYINQDGISQSTRAMHMQTELMGIHADNVVGFDKVGYQRKEGVVAAFSEIIGIHALSKATDDKAGRIFITDNPLDFAIADKGYFQIMDQGGVVKLTRDGRFKLNKEGELLALEGQYVLSQGGGKITLPFLPEKLEDIRVTDDGKIGIFNPKTLKLEYVDTISVVSSEGRVVLEPKIAQAHTEASNVALEQEYLEMVPVRRTFEANRQMYMLQNSNLTRAVQELGRA